MANIIERRSKHRFFHQDFDKRLTRWAQRPWRWFIANDAKAKPLEHGNIAGLLYGVKGSCSQPGGQCRIAKVREKCAGNAFAAKSGINRKSPQVKAIGLNREEHGSNDPIIYLRNYTIR